METPLISNKQFNKIKKHLPVPKHSRALDDRKVLSAIILVIRHGLPWRHIPDFYGKWSSIHCKFRRWSKAGIIKKIFSAFTIKLPKRCAAMIDSTFVKAQRTASSMRSDGESRELGRSRGGITTKIHLLSTSDGKPIDFIITGGQRHDVKVAPKLIEINNMKKLVADKAYGSKSFRKQLEERKIEACIPPKSNEKNPANYDKELYKKRHKIENMFARLKDWKGIAFRGNRCGHTFHSFIALALVFIFF